MTRSKPSKRKMTRSKPSKRKNSVTIAIKHFDLAAKPSKRYTAEKFRIHRSNFAKYLLAREEIFDPKVNFFTLASKLKPKALASSVSHSKTKVSSPLNENETIENITVAEPPPPPTPTLKPPKVRTPKVNIDF